MTLSLDGYVADPGDGTDELFDANSAEMLREVLAGAGRRRDPQRARRGSEAVARRDPAGTLS
ncbi:hypothetical protein [Streptomyces griseorubiginosus]|uniref:hypothetical protein n=1 Tax=Streptomyces griseorubiginosus TaxID=67304 RepID=UPI0033EB9582